MIRFLSHKDSITKHKPKNQSVQSLSIDLTLCSRI